MCEQGLEKREALTFCTALAILSASWALFLASVASAAALPSASCASLVFSLASAMVRLMAGILLSASSAAVLLSFTRLSKSKRSSRHAFELNCQNEKWNCNWIVLYALKICFKKWMMIGAEISREERMYTLLCRRCSVTSHMMYFCFWTESYLKSHCHVEPRAHHCL